MIRHCICSVCICGVSRKTLYCVVFARTKNGQNLGTIEEYSKTKKAHHSKGFVAPIVLNSTVMLLLVMVCTYFTFRFLLKHLKSERKWLSFTCICAQLYVPHINFEL